MSEKSLLIPPSEYTVLDLETTGLDPSSDSITEIGCIRIKDGKAVSTFQTLVKPAHPVSAFITELTGITNEMLEDAPLFSEIAEDLFSMLEGQVLIGHNVRFDIRFLQTHFMRAIGREFTNDFVDTLRLSRKVLPELAHHRLSDLGDYFGVNGTHHRALADCEITAAVLTKLLETAEIRHISLKPKNYPKSDLRKIRGNPALTDPDHPFFGKVCVFTGELASFSREKAAERVCSIGGICENNVTRRTAFLIMGSPSPLQTSVKSCKVKRAENLITEGRNLQLLGEAEFLDLLKRIRKV